MVYVESAITYNPGVDRVYCLPSTNFTPTYYLFNTYQKYLLSTYQKYLLSTYLNIYLAPP